MSPLTSPWFWSLFAGFAGGLAVSTVTCSRNRSLLSLFRAVDKKTGPVENSSDESEDSTSGIRRGVWGEETKMVIAVRMDLAMGKGKIAAQCAHAAVGMVQKKHKKNRDCFSQWLREGQRKVVVKVNDEEEMAEIVARCSSEKTDYYIVHDAGRTQVASGSATCVAVGPGPESVVDKITGHLKLL